MDAPHSEKLYIKPAKYPVYKKSETNKVEQLQQQTKMALLGQWTRDSGKWSISGALAGAPSTLLCRTRSITTERRNKKASTNALAVCEWPTIPWPMLLSFAFATTVICSSSVFANQAMSHAAAMYFHVSAGGHASWQRESHSANTPVSHPFCSVNPHASLGDERVL